MTIRVNSRIEQTNARFNQYYEITIGDNAVQNQFRLLDCPDDAISGNQGAVQEIFFSQSNIEWKAEYTVSLPSGVTVSAIALSPR